ncbi:MAG: S-layer homology domain-containing protein [Clostridia bacterium]|nr:S-layer homology domain-containing protein [Clostridia bacterium]
MKIKRLLAAVTLSSLALANTAMAAEFNDIKGHWAENIINDLADAGVVHGVSDGEFNPDGTVTRAEFFKMALGAVGIEDVTFREGECLDVTASDWYGPCIQSALDKGLVPEAMIKDFSSDVIETEDGSKAVYNGTLSAETPIKREEMAYVAQSVYQYSMEENVATKMNKPADLYFTDVKSISRWALDGVRHAYANGIVFGMEDDSFRPQDTATRAQAATIISNMLSKME